MNPLSEMIMLKNIKEISFGSLNIRGLLNYKKLMSAIQFINDLKLNIILLQEINGEIELNNSKFNYIGKH